MHCSDVTMSTLACQITGVSIVCLTVCSDAWMSKCIPCWCNCLSILKFHHSNDVIMGAIASQITSLTIVYSTVNCRRRSKKTSKLRDTDLCAGNSPGTGEFPAQMASNAEDVSIWWRHHVSRDSNKVCCDRNKIAIWLYTIISTKLPPDCRQHFKTHIMEKMHFDENSI